jgi:N-acetylglucosaminyldiphosphoundecaprenol N-acetyl-beta-D-mannosaminyltransferase
VNHSLPRDCAARVRFGQIWIDAVTSQQALAEIERLVDSGHGGAVFTPNIDHVVVAEVLPGFRAAYQAADLVLADGQPLVWLSRWVGWKLPEKISGSDLFLPLMDLAARRKFRVYLLGAGPGVAAEVAERLRRERGVDVVGADSPVIGLSPRLDEAGMVETIAAARPHLVLACLGTPKGELFVGRVRARLQETLLLSMGASLDFYAGRVRRAPKWMQHAGLEWLFRLLQEPRRLARRYLVDDLSFLPIFLRTLRSPVGQRVLLPRPASLSSFSSVAPDPDG